MDSTEVGNQVTLPLGLVRALCAEERRRFPTFKLLVLLQTVFVLVTAAAVAEVPTHHACNPIVFQTIVQAIISCNVNEICVFETLAQSHWIHFTCSEVPCHFTPRRCNFVQLYWLTCQYLYTNNVTNLIKNQTRVFTTPRGLSLQETVRRTESTWPLRPIG